MSHSRYYTDGGKTIPNWRAERQRMVEGQLRKRGIRDPRVLAAMLAIPQEAVAWGRDPTLIGCVRLLHRDPGKG